METYKARRNDDGEVQTNPKKEKKKQEKQAVEKLYGTVAEGALDYFTGGQFGMIKGNLEKVPGVGKAVNKGWNAAVKVASRAFQYTPGMGKIAKGLDDAGVIDAAKTVTGLMSGGKGADGKTPDLKLKAPNNSSSNTGNTGASTSSKSSGFSLGSFGSKGFGNFFGGKPGGSNSTSNSFLSFLPKPLRIKIYIALGCSCFLLLCFMTVFVDTDEVNVDSSTSYTASAAEPEDGDSSGSSSSETSKPTGVFIDNFTFYYQTDYKKEDFDFGGSTISKVGCGPTAMAMVLTNILGKEVTPIEMAQYTLDNNHAVWESGVITAVRTSLFQPAAQKYGINYEQIALTEDSMKNNLSNGKLLILLIGPGDINSGNHFIILRGISSDKSQIYLADPYKKSNNFNSDNTPRGWTYSELKNEALGNNLFAFSKNG